MIVSRLPESGRASRYEERCPTLLPRVLEPGRYLRFDWIIVRWFTRWFHIRLVPTIRLRLRIACLGGKFVSSRRTETIEAELGRR